MMNGMQIMDMIPNMALKNSKSSLTVGGIQEFMFISSITGSIGINHVIFYILLALSENSRGTCLKDAGK